MSALGGKRIVVTRAPHQADEIVARLQAVGAVVLRYPCIGIVPVEQNSPLSQAITGEFEWVVITSTNTVRALSAAGMQPSRMRVRWAAVGPGTAEALRTQFEVRAECVPAIYRADALAETIPLAPGDRVFLPQSEAADNSLALRLTERGATVTRVVAYRTTIGHGGVDLPGLLRDRMVDAITLTSGTTILNLLKRIGESSDSIALLTGIPLACVGAETAAIVRQLGLKPTIVPPDHTIASLVSSLASYFEAKHVR